LKPVPPQEYDGSPDAQAFYRFVRQGSAYVRAGRVLKDEQIFYLPYCLKGKVSDFYEREVAKDESQWSLEQFFWGLFEYCFPVNFRSKQRDKLNRCFQNSKSISEHTAEWLQIYNMIGSEDNQEKVLTPTSVKRCSVKIWIPRWTHGKILLMEPFARKELSIWTETETKCSKTHQNGNSSSRNHGPPSRGSFFRGRGGRVGQKSRHETLRTSTVDLASNPTKFLSAKKPGEKKVRTSSEKKIRLNGATNS
jgi:hypothetical protein